MNMEDKQEHEQPTDSVSSNGAMPALENLIPRLPAVANQEPVQVSIELKEIGPLLAVLSERERLVLQTQMQTLINEWLERKGMIG
jgi:hypothetical protein